MSNPTSRRAGIKATPRKYRKLDTTPVELPAGTRTIPSTKDMVKQYVTQALIQAGGEADYDTVDEMLSEELDLDPIDDDPEWTSRYEVTEMGEVEPPREAAPQPEGVAPQPEPEGEPEKTPEA